MESLVLETRAVEAKLGDLGRRATFANFEAFCMIMNFIPTFCKIIPKSGMQVRMNLGLSLSSKNIGI